MPPHRSEISSLVPNSIANASSYGAAVQESQNIKPKSRRGTLVCKATERFDSEQTDKTAIDDVLREIEDDEKQNKIMFWRSVISITMHVIGGAYTMRMLEGWSWSDAIYFCIVTTTTVGYGDITPQRSLSKLFVVYYIVFSIALISTFLAFLVGLLIDRQEEIFLDTMLEQPTRNESQPPPRVTPQRRERNNNYILQLLPSVPDLSWSDLYTLFFSTATLLVILAIGVTMFLVMEKLSFVDSLYATVISASTVGFGDVQPTFASTKMFVSVWLCFSTICVGKIVADFTEAILKSKQRAASKRVLSASMDYNSLRALDRDKDSKVDKTEFLGEMLVRTGKVDRAEIDDILKRFEQLDSDKSGFITSEECV